MVKEENVHECVISEHPVERGLPVSDHIRQKSERLTVEGVITNTPIDPVLAGALPSTPGIPRLELSRAEAVYQTLCDLWRTPALIPIKTSSRTYENMALVSLSTTRDEKSGDALKFTGVFQSVRLVDLKTSNVAVKTKRGGGLVSQGGKSAAPPRPGAVPTPLRARGQ
jgi:hypothetical protein